MLRSGIAQVPQEPPDAGVCSWADNLPDVYRIFRTIRRTRLVGEIFEEAEKLARWSVWAAMLTESTVLSSRDGGRASLSKKCMMRALLMMRAWGGGRAWRKIEERTFLGSEPQVRHCLMET